VILSRTDGVYNLVIKTKSIRKKMVCLPNHYKIDVAFPDVKLGVEIDGASHGSLKRKAQDRKKEKALKLLGWKVLRFSNSVVMKKTKWVVLQISSTISKLKTTQATL